MWLRLLMCFAFLLDIHVAQVYYIQKFCISPKTSDLAVRALKRKIQASATLLFIIFKLVLLLQYKSQKASNCTGSCQPNITMVAFQSQKLLHQSHFHLTHPLAKIYGFNFFFW